MTAPAKGARNSPRKAPDRPPAARKVDYGGFCSERALYCPAGLPHLLAGPLGKALDQLVYWPDRDPGQPNSLAHGLDLLTRAVEPPPPNLLPLIPVDARSIACAVCFTQEESDDAEAAAQEAAPCSVVRWHLGACPPFAQGALLDSDAELYLDSIASELAVRPQMLGRLRDVAARYQSEFVDRKRRPRSHQLKPIQVACQNVIVGLATMYQDVTFDGLRVEHYLACEAPHLAAHEGDRALLAILLCEAFQCGGTMEIRFGAARGESGLPESLRRYGRTLGIALGAEDRSAISPAEARTLFLAITPMTDDLRERCADAMDRGLIAPERLCFTLMANHWDAQELDYILATSPRAASILAGGTAAEDQLARLAELETCRAALMAGMFARRLSSRDGAASSQDGVRVFEDSRADVQVRVLDEAGAIALARPEEGIPWLRAAAVGADRGGPLIAVPRGLPVPADLACVATLAKAHPDATVALLVPADMAALLPPGQPLLVCPDRLAQLDAQVERRLAALELGRS